MPRAIRREGHGGTAGSYGEGGGGGLNTTREVGTARHRSTAQHSTAQMKRPCMYMADLTLFEAGPWPSGIKALITL